MLIEFWLWVFFFYIVIFYYPSKTYWSTGVLIRKNASASVQATAMFFINIWNIRKFACVIEGQDFLSSSLD